MGSAGRFLRLVLCGLAICGPALGGSGWGQTLAHKNWAGSGMTVEPWWAGAELYEIDPIDFADANGDGFGDLRGIAERLDYLEALGVDVMVLSSMPLRLGQGGAAPFDEVNGTVEDFDQLVVAAAARKIRVMVDLRLRDNESEAELLAEGRFWLSRGVAGLRVVADPGAPVSTVLAAERTRELRRLCLGFAGQRVVLSAVGGGGVEVAEAAVARVRRGRRVSAAGIAGAVGGAGGGAQMVEDTRLLHARSLGELRGSVRASDSGVERVAVTDADGVMRSWSRLGMGIGDSVRGGVVGAADGHAGRATDDGAAARAKAVAAVLLLGGGSPLVYFGQEVGMAGAGGPEPMQWGAAHPFTVGVPWIEAGPNAATANVAAEEGDADSLLRWYRRLGELRRGNAALRAGSVQALATGSAGTDGAAVLAWVRRARLGEREAAPVVVMVNLSPYAAAVPAAGIVGLGGGGLRVLATTFPVASATVNGPVALPAFGVFVGEVKKAAGLETVVLPPRKGRRR